MHDEGETEDIYLAEYENVIKGYRCLCNDKDHCNDITKNTIKEKVEKSKETTTGKSSGHVIVASILTVLLVSIFGLVFTF